MGGSDPLSDEPGSGLWGQNDHALNQHHSAQHAHRGACIFYKYRCEANWGILRRREKRPSRKYRKAPDAEWPRMARMHDLITSRKSREWEAVIVVPPLHIYIFDDMASLIGRNTDCGVCLPEAAICNPGAIKS
jgi:hypothetical protein